MAAMSIDIRQEPITEIAAYGCVTAAFCVNRVMDITTDTDAPGRFVMSERELSVPYMKDYDALEGGRPQDWSDRFDLSNWALFSARVAGRRLGWAAVAFDVPEVSLEHARGLAILWDLRVAPEARGKGVGSRLFESATAWAQAQGCRRLMIETQNINV